MNDWIWLDPQELASAGVLLRDVSQELIDSTHRTRAACCVTRREARGCGARKRRNTASGDHVG